MHRQLISVTGRRDSQFRQVFLAGAAQAANGETGLIETEGKLGIISETLANSQTRNQAEQISLTSSYIITSRLAGLSLSNYLR